MNPPKFKPSIFIGSSSEGLPIAREFKTLLSNDASPTLWEQDIFLPSIFTLEVLEEQLEKHLFAALIATPDDILVNVRSRVKPLEIMFFSNVDCLWEH